MDKPDFCDNRSWKNIVTLNEKAKTLCLKWLEECRKSALPVVVICGTRTYKEQDELYAQGRTKAGNIVTNARGGQSNHNFGLAWDFGVFDSVNENGGGGKYHGEDPVYHLAGAIAEDLGLEWGGSWKGIVDEPHIQLKTGLTIAQMRERFESGKGFDEVA